MKIGSYIRHFIYRNRGEKIYRYGIIIEVVEYPPPTLANVFWNPLKQHQPQYCEIIKINLIELISEPR
tara:strand:+ start:6202 stop:6405 length:204 start_codon:yes stop_codon:yes gene_type:complete